MVLGSLRGQFVLLATDPFLHPPGQFLNQNFLLQELTFKGKWQWGQKWIKRGWYKDSHLSSVLTQANRNNSKVFYQGQEYKWLGHVRECGKATEKDHGNLYFLTWIDFILIWRSMARTCEGTNMTAYKTSGDAVVKINVSGFPQKQSIHSHMTRRQRMLLRDKACEGLLFYKFYVLWIFGTRKLKSGKIIETFPFFKNIPNFPHINCRHRTTTGPLKADSTKWKRRTGAEFITWLKSPSLSPQPQH